MKTSHLDVDLGTTTIPCSTEDLKAIFGWLLLEKRSVAKVLRSDERVILRAIMSHTDGNLTVSALFPAFKREGESHKTLRRLRATQFVYPARTGRWEPDELIVVTPFAKIIWDQLGEAGIFSSAANEPKRAPADTCTPPPKNTPVTWDNLLECLRERQKALAPSPAATQQS